MSDGGGAELNEERRQLLVRREGGDLGVRVSSTKGTSAESERQQLVKKREVRKDTRQYGGKERDLPVIDKMGTPTKGPVGVGFSKKRHEKLRGKGKPTSNVDGKRGGMLQAK